MWLFMLNQAHLGIIWVTPPSSKAIKHILEKDWSLFRQHPRLLPSDIYKPYCKCNGDYQFVIRRWKLFLIYHYSSVSSYLSHIVKSAFSRLVDSRCLRGFRPRSSTHILTLKTFPEEPSLLLGVCPNMISRGLLPFTSNLVNGGLHKATTTKLLIRWTWRLWNHFISIQKFLPIVFTSQHSVKHCWHDDYPAGWPKMRKRTNSVHII